MSACFQIIGVLCVTYAVYHQHEAIQDFSIASSETSELLKQVISLNDPNAKQPKAADIIHLVDTLHLSSDSRYPKDPVTGAEYEHGFALKKEIEMYQWIGGIDWQEFGVQGIRMMKSEYDADQAKHEGDFEEYREKMNQAEELEGKIGEVVRERKYVKRWGSGYQAPKKEDPEEYHNPPHKFFSPWARANEGPFYATHAVLGKYRSPSLSEIKTLPDTVYQDITKSLLSSQFSSQWKYENGWIHNGKSTEPQIGDIRMQFFGADLEGQNATFFGSVGEQKEFEYLVEHSHQASNKKYFFFAIGEHEMEEVTVSLNTDNEWGSILSLSFAYAFVLMCIGFGCISGCSDSGECFAYGVVGGLVCYLTMMIATRVWPWAAYVFPFVSIFAVLSNLSDEKAKKNRKKKNM